MGKLTAFELSNFDNYRPKNLESIFKAKLSMKDTEEVKPKKKKKKVKYTSNDINTDEEDVEQLETLLARRFHKGKGKFKGQLPIIYFNSNEVGYIATRCTQKKNHREGNKNKNRREDDSRYYKDKGKKATLLKKKILMKMMMR